MGFRILSIPPKDYIYQNHSKFGIQSQTFQCYCFWPLCLSKLVGTLVNLGNSFAYTSRASLASLSLVSCGFATPPLFLTLRKTRHCAAWCPPSECSHLVPHLMLSHSAGLGSVREVRWCYMEALADWAGVHGINQWPSGHGKELDRHILLSPPSWGALSLWGSEWSISQYLLLVFALISSLPASLQFI